MIIADISPPPNIPPPNIPPRNILKADVTEIMLRKNFNTPVYGKCCFGLESYFQLREPLYDPRKVRDETRPFDEDLLVTPEIAAERLRKQGISYIA